MFLINKINYFKSYLVKIIFFNIMISLLIYINKINFLLFNK